MRSIVDTNLRNAKIALVSYETGQPLTLWERDRLLEAMRRELENLGLAYKRVTGCYKGDVEDTFMVIMDDSVDDGDMIALGRQYDQESVLILEAATGPRGREATLHYCDGNQPPDRLGMFRAVEPHYALYECGGYTWDPTTRKFYAIVD